MRVDRYEVLSEVARGGMGVVYRARDVSLDRVVALKLVLGDLDAEARARFVTEAQAAAGLAHPGIVAVHAAGALPDGRPWLAMDWIEGESLRARLRREGRFAPTEAARIVGAVARALAHAHERGVVHRDVKPENILLLAEDGRPLLTDFGVARVLSRATRLTRTGELLGTPAYMAPEQALGDPSAVGRAADVWALGAVLHEALVGSPPFAGTTVVSILDQVLSRAAPPPSSFTPGLDRGYDELVARCLEKDAARRGTAAELAAALEALASGRQRSRPRRSPATLAAAGAAALGLVAVAVSLALGDGAPDATSRPPPPRAPSAPAPPPVAAERPWLRVLRPGDGFATWSDEVEVEVVAEPPGVPPGAVVRVRVGRVERDLQVGQPAMVRARLDLGMNDLGLQLLRDQRASGPMTRLRIERRAAPAWFLELPAATRPPQAIDGLEPIGQGTGPSAPGLVVANGGYRSSGTPDRPDEERIFCWIPPGPAAPRLPPGLGPAPASALRLERGVFLGSWEVTRAQFRNFLLATRHELTLSTFARGPGDEQPATEVDWFEAQAFCRWAGVRLPTDLEWLRAATGDEGRIYPWGDAPLEPGAVNLILEGGRPALHSPSAHGRDLAPFGCLGLGGNAAEWVADRAPDREDDLAVRRRVVRGGAANEGAEWALNAFSHTLCPALGLTASPEDSDMFGFTGFRVALDADGRTRRFPRTIRWRLRAGTFERGLGSEVEETADQLLATSTRRLEAEVESLDLRFRGDGPGDLLLDGAGRPLDPRFAKDAFCIVATASPKLPAGRWIVFARSDDGVRVYVNGKLVIDDWTRHGLLVHAVELDVEAEGPVDLRVEYFDLVGEATLNVDLVPDPP